MNALNKLKGQVLLEIHPEPANVGLRFSGAGMGIFGAITPKDLDAFVGQSVTVVRHVDGHVLELEFLGGSCMRIDLTGPGPESFSVHFDGGPIVVG